MSYEEAVSSLHLFYLLNSYEADIRLFEEIRKSYSHLDFIPSEITKELKIDKNAFVYCFNKHKGKELFTPKQCFEFTKLIEKYAFKFIDRLVLITSENVEIEKDSKFKIQKLVSIKGVNKHLFVCEVANLEQVEDLTYIFRLECLSKESFAFFALGDFGVFNNSLSISLFEPPRILNNWLENKLENRKKRYIAPKKQIMRICDQIHSNLEAYGTSDFFFPSEEFEGVLLPMVIFFLHFDRKFEKLSTLPDLSGFEFKIRPKEFEEWYEDFKKPPIQTSNRYKEISNDILNEFTSLDYKIYRNNDNRDSEERDVLKISALIASEYPEKLKAWENYLPVIEKEKEEKKYYWLIFEFLETLPSTMPIKQDIPLPTEDAKSIDEATSTWFSYKQRRFYYETSSGSELGFIKINKRAADFFYLLYSQNTVDKTLSFCDSDLYSKGEFATLSKKSFLDAKSEIKTLSKKNVGLPKLIIDVGNRYKLNPNLSCMKA